MQGCVGLIAIVLALFLAANYPSQAAVIIGIFVVIGILGYIGSQAEEEKKKKAELALLDERPDNIPDVLSPASEVIYWPDWPEINEAPDLSKLSFENPKRLSAHLEYINKQAFDIDFKLRDIKDNYADRRIHLEKQHKILLRLVHQSRSAIQSVEPKFPSISNILKHQPQVYVRAIPRVPAVLSSGAYERSNKRLANVMSAVGRTAYRDWRLAAGALVVSAIVGVIQYQKALRQMHEDHASVKLQLATAENYAQELSKSDEQLIEVSLDTHTKSIIICELLDKFNEYPLPDSIENIPHEMMETLKNLKSYSMTSISALQNI